MTAGKRNPIKKGPIILKIFYKRRLRPSFLFEGGTGYKYKKEEERKNHGKESF